MTIYEKIEEFEQSIETNPTRQSKKVILYSEGLKSKLTQTEYALQKLKEIAPQPESTTTTATLSGKFINRDEELNFYLDGFWAFLYSCLDVLSQLINIKYNLGLKEDKVSFNAIHNQKLSSLDTRIADKFKIIKKSQVFSNLSKYRNCSLHRRHIAIETSTKTVSVSSGYASTTTPSIVKVRTLCDDPYTIAPQFMQHRQLEAYCEKTQVEVFNKIAQITDLLKVI